MTEALLQPDLTHPAPYARAEDVERHFSALQNSHRLALHQWEGVEDYDFPQRLQTILKNCTPEGMSAWILDKSRELLSISLLPSAKNGRSMRAYDYSPSQRLPMAGYLIDLTQSPQGLGPKILRTSADDLDSDFDYTNKQFKLREYGGDSFLRDFYDQYNTEHSLRTLMAGPEGARYTELQADALGDFIDDPRFPHRANKYLPSANVIQWNEMLAAVPQQHVAAISLPVANPGDYQECLPYLELQGALLGLDHLNRGIDLPVVLYHVVEPHKGTITYVGQGKEMLTQKVTDVIAELAARGALKNTTDKRLVLAAPEVKRLLGFDLFNPPAPVNPAPTIERASAEMQSTIDQAVAKSLLII